MRSFSPVPSHLGMHMMNANPTGGFAPPPAYHNGGSGSGRNTPQSMFGGPGVFAAPMPSRPGTNYLDMPISGGFDAGFGGGLQAQNTGGAAGGPSDFELENAVQDLLRTADLNMVTKREVRRTLEERYAMDLTSRKTTINAAIDRVLSSQ
jgi:chitin synthase